MGSKVKKLLGMAAPLIGLIPGLQPLAAVGLGAGLGASSGGGLRGALSGALGSAIPGYGGALGKALGVSGAAGTGLGGALLGAGAGAAKGGLKNALLGGAAGGLGGYANAGGFNGLGDSLGLTGNNGVLGSAGERLYQGFGPNASSRMVGGNGILGATSEIGNALGIGSGGGGSTYSGGSNSPGSSSYGNLATSLLGGLNSVNANDSAESDLLKAQRKALSRYQPYVDAKFEPGDLTQDPGYQFRLKEGEQALGRQQAARGNYFSGGALKAAQDYGQGLADTTYNEAYNRWLQQNQQNIGVAGSLAGLDTEGGNVRAYAGINNSNVMNRSLSSLLDGYGAYSNTGAPLGQQGWRIDPRTGQPVYA